MKIHFDKNREDILFVQGYSSSWYPQRKRHLREYRPICFLQTPSGIYFSLNKNTSTPYLISTKSAGNI